MIEWLQNWYASHCDGNWEHDYGITIETLDNPGWDINIDLEGTDVILQSKEYELIKLSNEEWYGYAVENNIFNAAGDPKKLDYLISIFKELVEKNEK